MSLNIYTKIPNDKEFVLDNEAYFSRVTASVLDASADWIIATIDKGSFYDGRQFRDRWGLPRSLACLSTGCKTALNILYNPDVCFSLLECGMNVLSVIFSVQNASVLLYANTLLGTVTSADITVNGDCVESTAVMFGRLYALFEGSEEDV